MAQVDWLGPKVGGNMALVLHVSREPGELWQCSEHDDSSINITVIIIIASNTARRPGLAVAMRVVWVDEGGG